jgi:hypothetical protein
VPPLEEKPTATARSVRERIEQHRANPRAPAATRSWTRSACARELRRDRPLAHDDEGVTIDASGNWWTAPRSTARRAAQGDARRSDVFVAALTEKLLMYGVGRETKYYDMPACAAIMRDAAKNRYRFSDLILGVVKSPPFRCGCTGRPEAAERGPPAARRATMFITKKHLPRARSCGHGRHAALPLLDSMIPAGTALVKTAALPKSRFCGIYIPHGATMDKWTPATEAAASRSPRRSSRSRSCATAHVVSNLAHPLAGGKGSDAGADHARSAAVFLSGAHPRRARCTAARRSTRCSPITSGQETPLPSIEMCIEEVALNCGAGYGCAYYNTISWRNDTLPLPMENSPQVVFERLFGDGTNAAQRLGAQAAGQEHPRRRDRTRSRGCRAGSTAATARGSASTSTTSARSSDASRRRRNSRPAIRTCLKRPLVFRRRSRTTSS